MSRTAFAALSRARQSGRAIIKITVSAADLAGNRSTKRLRSG
jgi:hypothetical protein